MKRFLAAAGLWVALIGCDMPSRSPAERGPSDPGLGITAVDDETGLSRARTIDPQAKLTFGAERIVRGAGEQEYLVVEGRLLSGHRVRQERPPRGGELRARLGPDKIVPMPLKHTDVKAQIALYLGSVTVTQQYHNPYDAKIEAVYVFPLPDDAAIRDFVMQIGPRQIRGIIREREQARRIYHEARRQGHVASLLTQERPNVFTQAVANIEPGKEINVKITYFHALKYSEGVYEFHVPMVVGPRFNPPGTADGVGAVPRGARGGSGQRTEVQYLAPNEVSTHDVAVEVDVDAGVAIEEMTSPSHAVRVERLAPMRARVTLAPGDRIPNRDFILRYKAAGREVRAALAVSAGHFTLLLQPPASLEGVPAAPREMIFVLDCSGSMSGEPLAAAKRALRRCLERLSPNDTFQIIRFSDSASQMGARPVPATAENVRVGLRYMEGLTSEGGTMMIHGIRAALDFPPDDERYRIVSFMTDGYIGNEEEILTEVRRRLGGARIFSFGIGTSVNRYLLEAMARAGRGAAAFIPLVDADRVADDFYRRVEHPALTHIRVDWGGLAVKDLTPDPLPDLFVGRPVVLAGRCEGGKGTVTVSGRVGGKPCETSLAVDFDQPALRHPALPAVWARARIGELAEQNRAVEIRDLALKYGLVSDWTSFVAVDSATRTAGDFGTTVPVPVPVPAGVKYETTVPERK